ncbi:hypothetical protein GE21DRAFT_1309352 [Neurospora crassa]|nr:hypothetical protein B24H17.300 [imported] - Neurospora crassa [Neurospora crassa]KHE83538.1 hypothetical protein GE21DRAFT_1309352 [Neurospora crassa]
MEQLAEADRRGCSRHPSWFGLEPDDIPPRRAESREWIAEGQQVNVFPNEIAATARKMRSGRPIDGASSERSGKSKLEDMDGKGAQIGDGTSDKKRTTDYSVGNAKCKGRAIAGYAVQTDDEEEVGVVGW